MKCQMNYCCSPQQPPLSETEAVLDPLQGIYQRSPNTDISTTDGDIKRTGISTASTDTIIENQEAQAKLYAFGNAFSWKYGFTCVNKVVVISCEYSRVKFSKSGLVAPNEPRERAFFFTLAADSGSILAL